MAVKKDMHKEKHPILYKRFLLRHIQENPLQKVQDDSIRKKQGKKSIRSRLYHFINIFILLGMIVFSTVGMLTMVYPETRNAFFNILKNI